MKMIVPDWRLVGSTAPQEIPSLGLLVPCPLADSGLTVAEVRKLIKNGVPILLEDRKAS